jgi:hypothetical protein
VFSETSGVTRAMRCNDPEDIRPCYRCEDISETRVPQPYMVEAVVVYTIPLIFANPFVTVFFLEFLETA